tara:strand:- start:1074 stop:1283 length:210 start_codon:yes stop_codon:yes gene_type:complete
MFGCVGGLQSAAQLADEATVRLKNNVINSFFMIFSCGVATKMPRVTAQYATSKSLNIANKKYIVIFFLW